MISESRNGDVRAGGCTGAPRDNRDAHTLGGRRSSAMHHLHFSVSGGDAVAAVGDNHQPSEVCDGEPFK